MKQLTYHRKKSYWDQLLSEFPWWRSSTWSQQWCHLVFTVDNMRDGSTWHATHDSWCDHVHDDGASEINHVAHEDREKDLRQEVSAVHCGDVRTHAAVARGGRTGNITEKRLQKSKIEDYHCDCLCKYDIMRWESFLH